MIHDHWREPKKELLSIFLYFLKNWTFDIGLGQSLILSRPRLSFKSKAKEKVSQLPLISLSVFRETEREPTICFVVFILNRRSAEKRNLKVKPPVL
jgi:hypothetical protein